MLMMFAGSGLVRAGCGSWLGTCLHVHCFSWFCTGTGLTLTMFADDVRQEAACPRRVWQLNVARWARAWSVKGLEANAWDARCKVHWLRLASITRRQPVLSGFKPSARLGVPETLRGPLKQQRLKACKSLYPLCPFHSEGRRISRLKPRTTMCTSPSRSTAMCQCTSPLSVPLRLWVWGCF